MTEFRIKKHYRRHDKDEIRTYFTIEEYKEVTHKIFFILPLYKEWKWESIKHWVGGYDSSWLEKVKWDTEEDAKKWLEKECRARKLIIPKSEIIETFKCTAE